MKRLALSGIILSLLALGASDALASPSVTIDACNEVDAKAVNRILDLEYRDAGQGPLVVRLSCSDEKVTVRVRHGDSAERVLVVDLSAVLAVAKARTVALLIVELSNEIEAARANKARQRATMVPLAAPVPNPEAVASTEIYDPSAAGAPGLESIPSGESLLDRQDSTTKSLFAIGSPRLSGALGYSMLSQDFSTNDVCALCNYRIKVGAPSANVGAVVDATYGPRYRFAADVQYQYAAAEILFAGPREMVETGYQLHRFHAGARAGYEIDKTSAIAAYGRTSVKYESRVIENLDLSTNPGKLPSELLSGFTVGAMLELAELTPKISVAVTADILVYGNVKQTEGLADGIDFSTKAHYLGSELDYQWTSSTSVTWNYGYSKQTTDWSGWDPTSLRDHQGGAATRSDSVHSLFAGLSTSI